MAPRQKWLKGANNGVKPHTDKKIKRLQTTETSYEYYIFYSSCYFGEGYEFSQNLLVIYVIIGPCFFVTDKIIELFMEVESIYR